MVFLSKHLLTAIILTQVMTPVLAQAAAVPPSVEERLDKLENSKLPPYLGLGTGFGVVLNATDGDNNDASGILLQLKAYPTRLNWTANTKLNNTDIMDRLSVVAGMSVGDLTGAGLESPAYLVGLGIDIVDDVALVGGISWFEYDDNTGRSDTDFAPYFGVAIDLRIFNKVFGTGD